MKPMSTKTPQYSCAAQDSDSLDSSVWYLMKRCLSMSIGPTWLLMYCRQVSPTVAVPTTRMPAYLALVASSFRYRLILLINIKGHNQSTIYQLIKEQPIKYINSFIIITMNQFYNRYRSLFQLHQPQPQPHAPKSKHRHSQQQPSFRISQPKHPFDPTSTPQPETRKEHFANLNRSPALEEFESAVLPKLKKRHPVQNLYRLKTQIDQGTHIISRERADYDNNDNFYILPTVFPPQVPPSRRERVLTEGNRPLRQSRYKLVQDKNSNSLNSNNEDLQDELLRDYPKRQDTILEEENKHPEANSRVKMEVSKNSRVYEHSPPLMAQKWQVKILPEQQRQKQYEGDLPSPKQITGKGRYREYQNQQKYLYGIKDNQFAFVNSKLDEIKKSERYYPRGHINSYRDSLYRRRKQKNAIEDRRQQLRVLLRDENEKYGMI